MKVGQDVQLRMVDGSVGVATIVALTGSGPSGYKQLDLRLGDQVLPAVLHWRDSVGLAWAQVDEGMPRNTAAALEPDPRPVVPIVPEGRPPRGTVSRWGHGTPDEGRHG